jgi:hypothetical protein
MKFMVSTLAPGPNQKSSEKRFFSNAVSSSLDLNLMHQQQIGNPDGKFNDINKIGRELFANDSGGGQVRLETKLHIRADPSRNLSSARQVESSRGRLAQQPCHSLD